MDSYQLKLECTRSHVRPRNTWSHYNSAKEHFPENEEATSKSAHDTSNRQKNRYGEYILYGHGSTDKYGSMICLVHGMDLHDLRLWLSKALPHGVYIWWESNSSWKGEATPSCDLALSPFISPATGLMLSWVTYITRLSSSCDRDNWWPFPGAAPPIVQHISTAERLQMKRRGRDIYSWAQRIEYILNRKESKHKCQMQSMHRYII